MSPVSPEVPETPDGEPVPLRGWWPWRFIRARPRLTAALLAFLALAATFAVRGLGPASSVLLAFDLAAVAYLSVLAHLFTVATPQLMRRRARAFDTGRWGILWSGVVLALVVLVALSSELHATQRAGWLQLALAAASIILSWLFLNVQFAIHYAHGYYGDFGSHHAALEFPRTRMPDYWDFTYFAMGIGMTFQVSDVQVTSAYLRRVVLLHSVIAFFFNVFILAITVNIVAGQGG